MLFDPLFLLIVLLPGLLISGLASLLMRAAFTRYSSVNSMNGYSGAQAARILLDRAGIHNVRITHAQGYLGDHYNPATKELALSDSVYSSTSLAAIGVACHEAGHAIQHAWQYAPLRIRTALVPIANIGSSLGYIVMAVGLFISPYVVLAGVALFVAVLLFQLVTLPVEFDASARAKQLVVECGIVNPAECKGIDRVLNAAAMTYVAAVISTLLTLVYFLIRSGMLGGDE
jgi:Zn-dependent membrane protease YugP